MSAIDRSLRDLIEAGRGSTVLTHGRASLETALAALRAEDSATLFEVTASQAPAPITAALAAAIAGFAPRPFLWRHAETLARLRRGHDDHAESGALLAPLVKEIANVRPLVILVTDLDEAGADTLEIIRPLAFAAARDPTGTSFVVILHADGSRDTPSVAALAADLRSLPGYSRSEEAASKPATTTAETSESEELTLAAVAIALAPVIAEVVADIAGAGVPATEAALTSLLGKGLVHLDSEDGRLRYRAGDLAQAAVHLSHLPVATRVRLHERAAAALSRVGEASNARAQLDAMLSVARGADDRAQALLLRAELLAPTHPTEARASLTHFAPLAASLSATARLRAEIAAARAEIACGSRQAASLVLARARRVLARMRDSLPERAGLLHAVARLEIELTRAALDAAGAPAATAVLRRLSVATGASEVLTELRLLEGDIELAAGRTATAEDRFVAARDLASAMGNGRHLAEACIGLSQTALNTGRHDPVELAERAATLAERASEPNLRIAARVACARAMIARKRFEPARAILEALEGEAVADGPAATATRRQLDRAELARSELKVAAGDAAAANATIRDLADLAMTRADATLEFEARELHARALLALPRPARGGSKGPMGAPLARARAQARHALARARKLDHAHGLGLAELTWLNIAVAENDDVAAARHAAYALAAFERAGSEQTVSAVVATIRAIVMRRPKLKLSAALASRLLAGVELGALWSDDAAIDRRSLELVVSAIHDPFDVARALWRVTEAAQAPWAVVVHHGDVLAKTGEAPDDVVRLAVAVTTPPPRATTLAGRKVAILDVTPWTPSGTTPFLVLPRTSRGSPPGIVSALVAPLARALLASTSLATSVTAPGDGFGRMIGQSPAMLRLFALLERIAGNELPVLLQGESGTGKELAARAIHEASARKHGPFVPIDCAAIPESLIESELFGHKKGAFTGTVDDRKGLLEEAAGGTVFLDEISNIGTPVQAKLLRVLQERKVRRVGDTALRPIDVRLISAANRPLEEAVRAGAFREDLFFRLNVIEVRLPALRERKGDIPLLVESFLARVATPAPRLEREAMARLQAYDWPGNVRELENELRRAAVVARATVITADDLSPRIGEPAATANAPELTKLKDAVSAVERDLVRRALAAADGHRGRAALLLGLSHQGLLNKIRKYALNSPPGKPRST